jgi:DNA polymerase-3 subunit epsilon
MRSVEMSVPYVTMLAMGWMDQPRLGLDTETTGPDPTTAHLVTCYITRVCGDGTVEFGRDWLADPGIEIPEGAAAVHGISTEHARTHGRPEADVVLDVLAVLAEHWNPDTPLIAYNAAFDLTLLDHRARMLGVGELKIRGPVLDALVLDRWLNPYRKGKRKLIMNCERYGVALTEDDAHSADADCRAAVNLTWAMAARHPQLAGTGLRELYVVQRQAHRAWATGFQQWLRNAARREDESDEQMEERRKVVIDTEWPLRTFAGAPPQEEAS